MRKRAHPLKQKNESKLLKKSKLIKSPISNERKLLKYNHDISRLSPELNKRLSKSRDRSKKKRSDKSGSLKRSKVLEKKLE
jgi:hypothetical protein